MINLKCIFKIRYPKIPCIRKFVIVGIYESGFHEIDEKLIIGDITHLKFINKWTGNQVGSYEVFIDDFDNLEIITDAICKNIPSNLSNFCEKSLSICF